MDQSTQPRVPRFIFVIIPVILIAMYCYAAFFDTPEPEKTVNNFYTAYFTRDYDTVTQNLSVFWAVQFLPQYAESTPAELLSKRDAVMKEATAFIESIEKNNKLPEDIKIQVMQDYTKTGENGAIVAYKFIEKGKEAGMEAAILIKENDKFRIFEMMTVDETTLQQLKEVDIATLDSNFEQLLNSDEAAAAEDK